MNAEQITIHRPAKPLDQIRRDAEQDMARSLAYGFARSNWGQRMIRDAGESAVRRALERRHGASYV